MKIKMNKQTIIQELQEWNDAVLSTQALPFLKPFGLTIRFDADVFDEDERRDTDCIALYNGGSVFEKEIRYWINYEAMADFFIRENDCSQDAYTEQIHINIFHVIGSALIEMFSDWYGKGDEEFDTLVDNLPEGTLRSFLQGGSAPKRQSAFSEEFAACHQDNRATENVLYNFCMQYLSQNTVPGPYQTAATKNRTYEIEIDGRTIPVTTKEVLDFYPKEHCLTEDDIRQYAAVYTAYIKYYRECDRMLDTVLVRRLLDEEHLMKNGESDGFRLQLTFGWYVVLHKEDKPQVAPFRYVIDAYCLDNIQRFSRRYFSMKEALLHCLNGFNENAAIPDCYESIQDYLSKNPAL